MKRIAIVLMFICYSSTLFSGEANINSEKNVKKIEEFPFFVYEDSGSACNNFFPTGYMGDYGDYKIDEGCILSPHSGKSCIKIEYRRGPSAGPGWAGLYWQYPEKNWGNYLKGYDLSKSGKFSFWARGEKGGEIIEEFVIGGITGQYPDSDTAKIGPIKLTKDWKKYVISVKGKDLTHIIGGFAWFINYDKRLQESLTFYLDEIAYQE